MSVASMALKNLARQKRRTFLLGGAIAFGLLIITVVNGLTGSLIRSLEANISNLVSGHIFIQGVEKTDTGRVLYGVRDDELLDAAVAKLEVPVKYIAKTSTARQAALISDAATSYLTLTGADLGPNGYLHDRITVVEGQLDTFPGSDQILLSEATAKKLEVRLGDRISVQASTVNGQQNVLTFTVGALYKDPGIAAALAGAYAELDRVNALIDLPADEFNMYGIFLDDVATADKWGAALYAELQAQSVPLWARGTPQDQQKLYRDEVWDGTKYSLYTLNDALTFIRGIFDSLNLVAFGILMVLFLVIMVGISNTYRMVVYERTREIGTLRALGMQRRSIRNLFLLEAVFLGLGGILAGFLVGVIILLVLSVLDLSAFKDWNILLRDNRLALHIDGLSFLINLAVITGLTALAAFFPARKAGRLTPAEALRTTN